MDTRLMMQMNFVEEIDKLKRVFRQNYLADGSRRENDAEHSWHLAMMVMVLAEYFPGLDLAKTMKMVLIHDIVEIDAGDTFAYDMVGYEDKEERENAAARRLFSLVPQAQGAELKELWQEFEALETREAICAGVMDRIQPLLLNSASRGKMWAERGVTAAKVRERNRLVFEKGPAPLAEYVRHLIDDAVARKILPE